MYNILHLQIPFSSLIILFSLHMQDDSNLLLFLQNEHLPSRQVSQSGSHILFSLTFYAFYIIVNCVKIEF